MLGIVPSVMQRSKIPADVDGYIATAPAGAREKLMELRTAIRAAAPEAEEVISYHMPYYKLHGHLVGFAAFKDHVTLFGAFPAELRRELRSYKTGRGSVQFPFDKPLPRQLVTKIVKAHVKMNEIKASGGDSR
jgi:uncharacterized protein YdhG (YjbR/CyaY superfamily)